MRIRSAIASGEKRTVFREWVDGGVRHTNWSEAGRQLRAVAYGLRSRGFESGDRIGILGSTGREWVITDWAMLCSGFVSVPLDPLSSPEDLAFIIDKARLCGVVTIGVLPISAQRALQSHALEPLCFDALVEHPSDRWPGGEGECASIVHTSGTSGVPRGVAVSMDQLFTQASALVNGFSLTQNDFSLCHLPLSHIMGRLETLLPLVSGGGLAFTSPSQLIPSIPHLQPTLVITAPKILDRMAKASQDNPSVLREMFGQSVRLLISGGSAVGEKTARLFGDAGLPIHEGYGMTEACGAIAINTPSAFRAGTVGKPFEPVRVKLSEEGEVWIQGSTVVDCFDGELVSARDQGWYPTGDIGFIDEDGFLILVDRKKDLIALRGGKKVAPQKVERILREYGEVQEALVVGENQSFLTALLTVDGAELSRTEKIRELIETANQRLGGHEKIRDFRVVPKGFSIAAGEITTSSKIRRQKCAERYQHLLREMYRNDLD